ncbi:DUF1080 domain-containing protein [Ruania zhangjianzhongii]|uniref:3-keto-disaccharide hydrolase n=1 Tax=Ruania zhangjianzhongii TaxID=2603206 RepID=UPI0011CB44AC|nr:DUF1080 domain-containing protein [Ruania zhangjianzhongii]
MPRRAGDGRRRVRDVLGAFVALLIMTVPACAPAEAPECAAGLHESGYRVLFDGSRVSLEQWQMTGPGAFELSAECSMVTRGGMGLLWFPEEFEDYILRLDWAITDDDNSGVFVGFPDPGHEVWTAVNEGYEVQIDPSDAPDRTTGSIYTFQGADAQARDRAVNPAGDWNTYRIAVRDGRIRVHLNGVLVNEFTSDQPDRDLDSGHIGLQNHGEDDVVRFRNVQILELARSE